MPTYGETPSPLHTPHHAIRATRVPAYTPPPRYKDTAYVRIPIGTMATESSASVASEIEVGSIYPTVQKELRAAAAK